ncbi:MAG: entericidin A/B family lipoprotein [Desulfotignum sp.]
MEILGFPPKMKVKKRGSFYIWLPPESGSAKIWLLLNPNNMKSGGTMQNFLKNMIIILMLIALNFLMVSCNTMQGVGEDVESAGESIQDTAD